MQHSSSLAVSTAQSLTPVVPADVASLLGRAPILPGEDGEAYAALTARVAQALSPHDIVEWFWIKDIVDNSWESARLRRLRAQVIALNRARGLAAILRSNHITAFKDPEGTAVPAEAVVQAYVEGDPLWVPRVNLALANFGLTPEAIDAESLSSCVWRLDALDRMIAAADARRDAVTREVDRRRGARKAEARADAAAFTGFGAPFLTPEDLK